MQKLWEYKKLGDVCTVERGGSPRPIDKFITNDENGINWIKIGDTSDSMYITSTAQRIMKEGMKKSRYVKPGDFLLSNSMSFGRPYILKIDGCIHDGWLVLRDEEKVFDKRFLYYYLSSKSTYKKFEAMAVGGVVNNLNSEMVRNTYVPIPNKDVQLKIANQFDMVRSILESRKKELLLLENLVRARFVELFGDMVLNSNGWDKCKLGDVCDVRDGTHDSPQYYERGYALVTSKNLTGGKINLSDCSFICESDFQKINERSKVDYGDIIMPMIGTVGNPVIVDIEPNFAIKNVALIKFKENSKVKNVFVKVLFESQYFYNSVIRKVRGGTQKFISLGDIRNLEICLAPIDIQINFEEFVEQVNKSKFEVQKALDKAQLLFDSLMQKYFG